MPISFATDIRHLFTDEDVNHMSTFFDLRDFEDNKANATNILQRLKGQGGLRRMPPPPRPAWSPEQINLYEQWISDGCHP
jgi:hypothetical protein